MFLLLPFLLLGLGLYYALGRNWELQANIRLALPPLRLQAKLYKLQDWPQWWQLAAAEDTLFFFRGEARGIGASMNWKQGDIQHRLVVTQTRKGYLRYLHRIGEQLHLEGELQWIRLEKGSLLSWRIQTLKRSGSRWSYWSTYFQLRPLFSKQLQQLQQLLISYNEN